MAQTQKTRTERLTHAQRTDLSDRRMLDAAVALIVKRGPENTTLKDVGVQAGYSRGLAGYRFGSKQGLFEFVVRSIGAQWLQDLTQATADKTGLDAMHSAINAHYQFCTNGGDHVRAFYILWFSSAGPDSDIKNIVTSIDQRRHKDVAKWITTGDVKLSGHDAIAIAGQFSASITGIVYHWLAYPDDTNGFEILHQQLIKTMTMYMNR